MKRLFIALVLLGSSFAQAMEKRTGAFPLKKAAAKPTGIITVANPTSEESKISTGDAVFERTVQTIAKDLNCEFDACYFDKFSEIFKALEEPTESNALKIAFTAKVLNDNRHSLHESDYQKFADLLSSKYQNIPEAQSFYAYVAKQSAPKAKKVTTTMSDNPFHGSKLLGNAAGQQADAQPILTAAQLRAKEEEEAIKNASNDIETDMPLAVPANSNDEQIRTKTHMVIISQSGKESVKRLNDQGEMLDEGESDDETRDAQIVEARRIKNQKVQQTPVNKTAVQEEDEQDKLTKMKEAEEARLKAEDEARVAVEGKAEVYAYEAQQAFEAEARAKEAARLCAEEGKAIEQAEQKAEQNRLQLVAGHEEELRRLKAEEEAPIIAEDKAEVFAYEAQQAFEAQVRAAEAKSWCEAEKIAEQRIAEEAERNRLQLVAAHEENERQQLAEQQAREAAELKAKEVPATGAMQEVSGVGAAQQVPANLAPVVTVSVPADDNGIDKDFLKTLNAATPDQMLTDPALKKDSWFKSAAKPAAALTATSIVGTLIYKYLANKDKKNQRVVRKPKRDGYKNAKSEDDEEEKSDEANVLSKIESIGQRIHDDANSVSI